MKLKGVDKKLLMNWMLAALRDAITRGLTLEDMIFALEDGIRGCRTEKEEVIASGRY